MSKFSFSSKPAPPATASQPSGATPAGAPTAKPATKGTAKGGSTGFNFSKATAPRAAVPVSAPANKSTRSTDASATAVEPRVQGQPQSQGPGGMPDFSEKGDFFVPAAARTALHQMIEQKAEGRDKLQAPVPTPAKTAAPAKTQPAVKPVSGKPVLVKPLSLSPVAPAATAPSEQKEASNFSFANSSDEPNPFEGIGSYDGFDANELSRAAADDDAFAASMMDDGDFVGGIIQPKGAGRHVSVHPLAGIPDTAFEGFDPAVPPGSHYDSWVWDCLDKEGHVTIELYVDDKAGQMVDESSTNANPYPVFNPEKHCLISVPDYKGAPWGVARRVMMTPQTTRRLPEPKPRTPPKEAPKFTKFNPSTGKDEVKEEVKPPPVYVADPSGITGWLNNSGTTKPHHNVIFGRCIIADPKGQDRKSRDGEGYWMVISENDARRVQQRVHGDNSASTLDTAQVFGLEGVVHTQDVKVDRRFETQIVPMNDRKPVPATRRYFGEWRNDTSSLALASAKQMLGPIMPADWTQEDVDFLHNAHSSRREQELADDMQASIISPLDANPELAQMIPEREDQRVRPSQSIPAPRLSRMRG